MPGSFKILWLLFALFASRAMEAKVFERCELVRTLRSLGFPGNEIPTWMCICQHESNYNTNAFNPTTGDHGIFQISQIYWCSTSNTPGGGCNAKCSDFQNDDISDDARCARYIKGQSGFQAWTTYTFCMGDQSKYVAGC